MRLVTWNLERGGRHGARSSAQAAVLAELQADLYVVTEPHSCSVLRDLPVVSSPSLRQGNGDAEPWVAITGDGVVALEERPYERMAVAATLELRDSPPIVVYGSVLPWRTIVSHAPKLVFPGETYGDAFERVLFEQLEDMRQIRAQYSSHELIWAGDFNQSLEGANYTGSKRGRSLLAHALAELGLAAWNATAPHSADGMYAVDLICGPANRSPVIGTIPTVAGGRRMSDHMGYIANW